MELRLEQNDYASTGLFGVYRLILERPLQEPTWGWAPYIYEITGYNVVGPRRNLAQSTYAVKALLVTPYPDRCETMLGRLERPALLEAGEGKTGWRQRYCLHFVGKEGFVSKIDTPLLNTLIEAKLIADRLERAARDDARRQVDKERAAQRAALSEQYEVSDAIYRAAMERATKERATKERATMEQRAAMERAAMERAVMERAVMEQRAAMERAVMEREAVYRDNFGRPYIPNERPAPAPRRPAIPVQEEPKIKRRCFFDE